MRRRGAAACIGAVPQTPWENDERNRYMKDKFETFRATEKERAALKALAKRAKLSKSDYIRHCIFNKEIVVIDGLWELTIQLKAIGNNLNQLTKLANIGQINAVYLDETKAKLGAIYEKLAALCGIDIETEVQ